MAHATRRAVIEGAEGIGKSRLCRELYPKSSARGFRATGTAGISHTNYPQAYTRTRLRLEPTLAQCREAASLNGVRLRNGVYRELGTTDAMQLTRNLTATKDNQPRPDFTMHTTGCPKL